MLTASADTQGTALLMQCTEHGSPTDTVLFHDNSNPLFFREFRTCGIECSAQLPTPAIVCCLASGVSLCFPFDAFLHRRRITLAGSIVARNLAYLESSRSSSIASPISLPMRLNQIALP